MLSTSKSSRSCSEKKEASGTPGQSSRESKRVPEGSVRRSSSMREWKCDDRVLENVLESMAAPTR